jgi:catechol 2,3-dioxygenase-like lactoylglutathione lyase family enzyme
MQVNPRSIRPFLGSKDFIVSRNFYRDLGFEETFLAPNLSVFSMGEIRFYLQDAYVKDWVDNTQVFFEVDDLKGFWDRLVSLRLSETYPGVRIEPIRSMDWGQECFIHDPAGILWHVGQFV